MKDLFRVQQNTKSMPPLNQPIYFHNATIKSLSCFFFHITKVSVASSQISRHCFRGSSVGNIAFFLNSIPGNINIIQVAVIITNKDRFEKKRYHWDSSRSS